MSDLTRREWLDKRDGFFEAIYIGRMSAPFISSDDGVSLYHEQHFNQIRQESEPLAMVLEEANEIMELLWGICPGKDKDHEM